jgi:hypothetical protein
MRDSRHIKGVVTTPGDSFLVGQELGKLEFEVQDHGTYIAVQIDPSVDKVEVIAEDGVLVLHIKKRSE